jgi:mycofactocin precursor
MVVTKATASFTGEHSMTDEPTPTAEPTETGPAPLVEQDLLVEDVSIDGMCGVY